MFKGLGLLFLLIATISAGIGYAILSAPELPEHRLFNLAIKKFATHASTLERQFRKDHSIIQLDKQLNIDFSDLDGQLANIQLKMTAMDNLVTLRFGDGNTALANQTVLLEPYFLTTTNNDNDNDNETIRWKCIGGSVLIRFRSKACRLGKGIVLNEVIAP